MDFIYKGEFKNNKIEGFGTLKLPHGNIYKGKWLHYDSSEILSFYTVQRWYTIIFEHRVNSLGYESEFVKTIIKTENNNKFDGYGKQYINNQLSYTGQFKNGLREGYGIEHFDNNIIYEGEYKNDKKNGIGKHISKYRDIYYEGEFKNDKKYGIGKYISKDADIYEGEFRNNMKHGYGIYISKNRYKYQGEYENDKINGNGSFFFKSGFKIDEK